MENAESILVIITSSVLVLFLLLAIIVTLKLMALIKHVKQIVAKAEDVIESAEEVTEAFRQVNGPLAALKLIRNIMSLVDKKQKRKK